MLEVCRWRKRSNYCVADQLKGRTQHTNTKVTDSTHTHMSNLHEAMNAKKSKASVRAAKMLERVRAIADESGSDSCDDEDEVRRVGTKAMSILRVQEAMAASAKKKYEWERSQLQIDIENKEREMEKMANAERLIERKRKRFACALDAASWLINGGLSDTDRSEVYEFVVNTMEDAVKESHASNEGTNDDRPDNTQEDDDGQADVVTSVVLSGGDVIESPVPQESEIRARELNVLKRCKKM